MSLQLFKKSINLRKSCKPKGLCFVLLAVCVKSTQLTQKCIKLTSKID